MHVCPIIKLSCVSGQFLSSFNQIKIKHSNPIRHFITFTSHLSRLPRLARLLGHNIHPLAARIFLAHREARDAQVVRDIADHERHEARVGEHGDGQRDVYEYGRVTCGGLDDGGSVKERGMRLARSYDIYAR
jgi:hypothetical protein